MRFLLVSLLVLCLSGCTLIGASLVTEGYGVTLKAEIAGFTTEAGFDLANIIKEN